VLNEATLLFVVERPVDNEPMPVDAEVLSDDKPVDALVLNEFSPLATVEIEPDNCDAPVLSEEIPVEVEVLNDDTPVLKLAIPVDVEVLSVSIAEFVAKSCEPFIASVLFCVTWPAATFVIWRSAPFVPTLTTPVGLVPAY